MDRVEGCNQWSYISQDYTNDARALSKLIHRFPHFDFTLRQVNSTFAPRSKLYLQSLGTHACISLLMLIVTLMLLFTIFLMKTLTQKKAPPIWVNNKKRILNSLALAGLVISLFGFLSNIMVYFGLSRFFDEIFNIHLFVKSINKEVKTIKKAMLDTYRGYEDGVAYFTDIKESGIFINYSEELIAKNIGKRLLSLNAYAKQIQQTADDFGAPFDSIHLDDYIQRVWGWCAVGCGGGAAAWGSGAALCLCILLTLSARTKFAHLLLTIYAGPLGSLSAVSCSWVSSGVLTALSVALADACQRPGPALADNIPLTIPPQDVLYYAECIEQDNTITASRDALLMMKRSMVALRENLDYLIANKTKERYDEIRIAFKERAEDIVADLWPAEVALYDLGMVTECEATRKHFTSAVSSICNFTLKGILLQLLSVLLIAFMFTAVVATYIFTK